MKKILLATTMLAGTAGFAAAEVSFSGSAKAGIASDAGGDFDVYSSAGLDVTFSGATDSGLEFGATFGASMGHGYTFGDGDGWDINDGTFGGPEVYISGSFGRVAFNHNGYGFFHNDDGDLDQADIDYSGTFGGFSVGLRADVQDVNDAVPENANDLSATLGYTIAGVGLTANVDGTDSIEWDVGATYTMGAFTASAGYNHDSVANVKVEYSANGISASAAYDTDANVDVTAGWAGNGISVDLEYGDNLDVSDQTYSITAGYDLGGGLSLEAGYNYTSDAFIGAAMTF